MSSRTGGWFPFGGSDVDPGGYGGRDGLPSRGAPTALGSGVLVLMVGRGWRGEDAKRPSHPTEPPTVTALGSWVLVLMVGRGWRVGRMQTGPPRPFEPPTVTA